MNRKKLFKYISFGLGAALAVVTLYLVFSSRAGLPPGVCPVNNGLPFAIPALVLLVTAFVTSFYAEKPKPKSGAEEKPADTTEKQD